MEEDNGYVFSFWIRQEAFCILAWMPIIDQYIKKYEMVLLQHTNKMKARRVII